MGFGFLVTFAVAAAVSAIGFRKFVWFISLGYGFSVAAIGAALLVMGAAGASVTAGGPTGGLTPVTAALCVLLVVYGCRLGGFLLARERRSASYRDAMRREIKDGSGVPVPAKIATWLSCALLYACETSPVLFRLTNANGFDGATGSASDDWAAWTGLAVMIVGIALESVADHTKSAFKKDHPRRFCDVGVYRLVRCPNYLGEVLTWTGVFVSGWTAARGFWQWVAMAVGWLVITWIMFGGARRLEIRQTRNYGDDPDYRNYAAHTPILIPFAPLYSVAKLKWLVG
ncbi:DUF1295 domain-containing protein [Bifidobacterium avesanii]|uniref:DUF1295 domain-containing protein n=1 Tax=Bifidobacterium avesanii TaxID=1798157 RepID=A0A7K3TGN9_9BIFI|nr:DUF1295 domain-containing protein [Bifidobacterium avesanii]NEG78222.1 DUF1295 domain-containing protein [Bifidobacterium avesanii]